MDLKAFFKKVRDIENSIVDLYTVIVSKETPEGGRAGVLTEVPKGIAAKLVAEDRAALAAAAEVKQFRDQMAEAQRQAQQAAASARLNLTVIPESDLDNLRSALRPAKSQK